MEVTKTLNIIQEIGSGLGLELNIHKTKTFWPSCNGSKTRRGLFLSDIGRQMLGMELLGVTVS